MRIYIYTLQVIQDLTLPDKIPCLFWKFHKTISAHFPFFWIVSNSAIRFATPGTVWFYLFGESGKIIGNQDLSDPFP